MTNTQDPNLNKSQTDIDPITGLPLDTEVLEASELPSELAGINEGNTGASTPDDLTSLNGAAKASVELPDDLEASEDQVNNTDSK